MPVPLIPIIVIGGVTFLTATITFICVRNRLKNKTIIFLGPKQSGKTTLVNWIVNDFPTVVYSPTGNEECKEYKDEENKITLKTSDYGGADGLLVRRFDELIKEKDIIVFVFNVNTFIEVPDYRKDVFARLEFIFGHIETEKQKIILVGSHRDKRNEQDGELISKVVGLLNDKVYLRGKCKVLVADLLKKKQAASVYKEIVETIKQN